jgi:hypothetical protein
MSTSEDFSSVGQSLTMVWIGLDGGLHWSIYSKNNTEQVKNYVVYSQLSTTAFCWTPMNARLMVQKLFPSICRVVWCRESIKACTCNEMYIVEWIHPLYITPLLSLHAMDPSSNQKLIDRLEYLSCVWCYATNPNSFGSSIDGWGKKVDWFIQRTLSK